MSPTPEPGAVVFVVDDDASMRRSTERLIRSVGFSVQTFGSAKEFLNFRRPDLPACLVLDVRLPDSSGLDLQHELSRSGIGVPVIFITAHGDIPMSVQAMKAGAVEFLSKPFREEDLLGAIRHAIERDAAARQQAARVAALRARYERLTARQREVMALVVAGKLNKQIAADLESTEKTVKVHRGEVMHRMQADSLADLVRMAEALRTPDLRQTSEAYPRR